MHNYKLSPIRASLARAFRTAKRLIFAPTLMSNRRNRTLRLRLLSTNATQEAKKAALQHPAQSAPMTPCSPTPRPLRTPLLSETSPGRTQHLLVRTSNRDYRVSVRFLDKKPAKPTPSVDKR